MNNQKDLFTTAEIDLLHEKIADLTLSQDNLRKALFARHDQFKRDLEKIKEMISGKPQIQIDFTENKISHIGA